MKIKATERTPAVDFDFDANVYCLCGESYPEDAVAFYNEVIPALENHLKNLTAAEIRFRFEITYFNSSSARVVMYLFELLEETAKRGNTVSITWAYLEDDDTFQEHGEDFGEDLKYAGFAMEALTAQD